MNFDYIHPLPECGKAMLEKYNRLKVAHAFLSLLGTRFIKGRVLPKQRRPISLRK